MEQATAPGNLSLPRHVAIIMDGNGRWAKQRGKIRIFGHSNAVEAVKASVRQSLESGIGKLTLFAFSSENWRRPQSEIDHLLSLLARFLDTEIPELHRQGVRVRFVGDMSRFSEALREKIRKAQKLTEDNARLELNIAASYGGRWDIVSACRNLMAEEGVRPQDVTEELFASRLAVPDDVDLMIRTGGEMRISNFLIWQLAYAELYVTDVLWPDFSQKVYADALKWYSTRERRFGFTGDQVRQRQDSNKAD
ncbi:MAG: di-trans,poly-cis-decaprenylcistransferase [Succinivibrionaceae bacterium]|nr:di-trans,poly-cis-decaprenylcistransferase [Succinivibrionaceae bacterium]